MGRRRTRTNLADKADGELFVRCGGESVSAFAGGRGGRVVVFGLVGEVKEAFTVGVGVGVGHGGGCGGSVRGGGMAGQQRRGSFVA